MNGVEILSSEEVAIAWETFNWPNFWIGVGISFIIALAVSFIFWANEQDVLWAFIMFVVAFIFCSLVLGLIIGFGTGEPTEYETHYKVTIDDSIPMSEFMDKYKIIDQDGKIYIVRERE
jgi:cytochrome bd-type quinol oxidase subunit 2